jgi:hypothetical protein
MPATTDESRIPATNERMNELSNPTTYERPVQITIEKTKKGTK